MVERFIRCRKCNQVLPLPCFLEDFEASGSLPGVEWSDEDASFRREFILAHGNHPQEELRVDLETIFSDKSGYGFSKTIYFEATNGRQNFLIKRTKPGLEYPARYEILPGRMKIFTQSIKIQEGELRRQLSANGNLYALPEEKASEFIKALSEEVAVISSQGLFQEFDAMAEGNSPRLLYASLKEERWEKILDRCTPNFQPSELRWIREFIRAHRQPGEVLSLLIHRKISFFAEDNPAPARPETLFSHP